MPGSYDLLCANVLGRSNGTLYATDFAQNLYAVEPKTGAAKLIGPTGVPALPFAPLTQNPDGSLNVFDESLFSFRGKLFVNFGALTFNPATGKAAPVIPAALYEIDHKTGHATWIAPIDAGITTIVNVSDTVYGFRSATEEVVTLDVTNGRATPVSELDPAARVVGGATPARPSSEDDR